MIALAIFAIAAMVCLDGFIMSVRHIRLLNENKTKGLLARWKIEELRIENEKLEEGSGIFPQPFEEYEWEISLSDIIITDTEYDVSFVPYRLEIKSGKDDFEILIPFVKTETGGE